MDDKSGPIACHGVQLLKSVSSKEVIGEIPGRVGVGVVVSASKQQTYLVRSTLYDLFNIKQKVRQRCG